MKKIRSILFICLLTTAFLSANAQNKDELQKKESELKREIIDLTNLLTTKQGARKLSVKEAAVVQRKIAAREELVSNINHQVKALDETIYLNELEIYRMKKELDTLKRKYAQSIVFAYKNRSNYQYLNFLFSATSFNDALKRMTYLKSYKKLRETQVDNIEKTQNLLKQKMGSLTANKKEQTLALQNQKGQLQELEADKKEKDKVIRELKGQEKEITSQLRKKEKQRQDMKNAIFAIIRRDEAEAARKAKIARDKELADAKRSKDQQARDASIAKTNETPKSSNNPKPKNDEPKGMAGSRNDDRAFSKLEGTEEAKVTSIKFEQRSLPWPGRGQVVVPFGPYNAGDKMTGVSDGIEIAMPEGSSVTCVADGKVSFVGDVSGEQVVIVKHGKYYTSYTHLSSFNVSKDQEVKAGTVLGKSGTDIDGQGSLYFMISNDKGTPLNPKSWLRSR